MHQGLRGHHDDSQHLDVTGQNPGTVQALLHFRIESGDHVLKNHFETAGKKTTQNYIINICDEFIREKILAEIQEAAWYFISVDEAADNSNIEHLTIVLRFVHSNCEIREEFMGFVPCRLTTGEAIADNIITKIHDWNLKLDNCREQTYNGAGNMAGAERGAAARITEES